MPSTQSTPKEISPDQFQFLTALRAVTDMLPLGFAVIPWGILCGSLAIEIGLNPWQAQAMSLFVFAGAAQLASLNLLAGSGSMASIMTSTAVISARHLLYSAVIREDVRHLPLRWRVSLAFVLTDEMFAMALAHQAKTKRFDPHYALISGFAFYFIWNVSTLAGITLGTQIPNLDQLGLEFAIAATFIALVVPNIKDSPTLIAVAVSALVALACKHFQIPHGMILATGTGMVAAYIALQYSKRNGKQKGTLSTENAKEVK